MQKHFMIPALQILGYSAFPFNLLYEFFFYIFLILGLWLDKKSIVKASLWALCNSEIYFRLFSEFFQTQKIINGNNQQINPY